MAVFISGDSQPCSRVGRSEFASADLSWLCHTAELTACSAGAECSLGAAPFLRVGIKGVGWEQSLQTSAVPGGGNVFEAVTVWEIRLELPCSRCYCLESSTFFMAVF